MALVIGLCGNAGAGKDTAADHLVDKHNFVKISLADPMKRMCKEVYGFSDGQLWGPSEMRNAPDPRWDGLTPRKALQLLGTEWGRACHPNTWIAYALRTAEHLLTTDDAWYTSSLGLHAWGLQELARPTLKGVVIPDVRFLNEVEAVRSVGGEVWRIKRHTGPKLEGLAGLHASETELEGIDPSLFAWTLHNDFSKAILFSSLDEVLDRAISK